MKKLFVLICMLLCFCAACGKNVSEYAETVSNNGGTVLQVGDYIYFYTPNTEYDGTSYTGHTLYKMRLDGSEKIELLDNHSPHKLYYVDGYIYTEKMDESDYSYDILRISVETSAVESFIHGSLNYVDVDKNEIFYNDNDDFWKTDLDGKNKTKLCSSEYSYLGIDDNSIYFEAPRNEASSAAVLASVSRDDFSLKTIASIPDKELDYEYEHAKNHIVSFGICDDRIILSVGYYEGTGHFFSGRLVGVNKDGTQMCFYEYEIDSFEIIGDWIYVNYDGCLRLSPDFENIEYWGDEADYLYASHNENLYYRYNPAIESSENYIYDLRQRNSDSGDVVTLFQGETAPKFEDSYSTGYSAVETVGDYVYFYLSVLGYNEGIDSWRGHECYYAYYRVRKDGSGLEILYELFEDEKL